METAYWYISVRFGKFSNRPINVPKCTKVYRNVPKCTRPSFSLCFKGKLRHLKCTKVYQNVPNCTSSRPGTVGCILEIYGAAQKHPNTFFLFVSSLCFFFVTPIAGPPALLLARPSPPGALGRREEGGEGRPGASHLSGGECSKAMYNQGWWV